MEDQRPVLFGRSGWIDKRRSAAAKLRKGKAVAWIALVLCLAAGGLAVGWLILRDESPQVALPEDTTTEDEQPLLTDPLQGPQEPSESAGTGTGAQDALGSIPALAKQQKIGPLAEAIERVDPAKDNWQTEALSDAVGRQLKRLGKLLTHPADLDIEHTGPLVSPDCTIGPLRPSALVSAYNDGAFRVLRPRATDKRIQGGAGSLRGASGLVAAIKYLCEPFQAASLERVKSKLVRVELADEKMVTRVLFQASGTTGRDTLQINATWRCDWRVGSDEPRLLALVLEDYEEIHYQGAGDRLLVDCTEAVLGGNPSFQQQLAFGVDHWRGRLARSLELAVPGHHGIALGDVNGDGLDDLYLCAEGGLPNRLLVRELGGTLRDVSTKSGTDWLDTCASALLVDLDNDGNQDLVVGQELHLLVMSGDGRGNFSLKADIAVPAQLHSLAAADYDVDGRLDLFLCGYNPGEPGYRRGVMGAPLPYHDANNGGRNVLLRNLGDWQFADVTRSVGLDENNRRFSFAATWEDFDNDGDLDLYVANDFGRNNLYRNEGGRFVDVADKLGVEDMSAGMSATWGDYNNDGRMDLYVSNMFSSAGNRITFQRQFKTGLDERVKAQFQRHARGNTLFENTGPDGFRDQSVAAGVTMGRWAWGSTMVDLNNDGRLDLVVANGYTTTQDSGDL